MARARNIKPSFFTNEQLADNCPLGRLLFIGLWTLADYKGDLEWKERTIKIQILPWDDCDLKKIAINLDKSGLIRFYSDGEKTYINIPNFEKHQNPHKNERDKGSDIPSYSDDLRQAIDLQGLTINRDLSGLKRNDSQSDRAESLILNPESLILNPESITPQAAVDVLEIFNHWKLTMRHEKAILDNKRKKLIQSALKLGYKKTDLISAIDGCAKSPHHMGQNDTGAIYDDLGLILRDAGKIDGFIKKSEQVVTYAKFQKVSAASVNFTSEDYNAGIAADGSF